MSLRRTVGLAVLSVALGVSAACALPVAAAPSASQTAADRAALERALGRYESARARSADLDARLADSSAELDRLITEEDRTGALLGARIASMYRTPNVDFISVLLGATTLEDLATRWDLLTRIARQDAETLESLKAARVAAERSAADLLDLQAEEARALDELAGEVARARNDLAASEAALRQYEARIAAAPKPTATAAPAPAKADATQQLTGTGAWLTGVASHYGRDFTGTGASGEEIGPYSMIVAHKTLPFGTLIEFEYNGKRAVARVADRGPHTPGRDFDLGPGLVRVLDFAGVDEVRYRIISQ